MNRRIDYIFAALSGLLLFFSFPTISLSLLAWVGLTPLLVSLIGKDSRSAGKLGLVTGFVYFYGMLYWLNILTRFDSIMPLATIILSLILSLYVIAFAVLFNWLSKRYPKSIWWLNPILWTTMEYIRGLGPLGFPWGLIGYSQTPHLELIQLSSITGVLGISFLIMLSNGILAQMAIEWHKDKKVYRKTLVLIIVFIILIGIFYTYGSNRINSSQGNSHSLNTAIIQGNIPQEMKWDDSISREHFQKHLGLTKEILNQKPDLVVWPETAITDFLSDSEEDRHQLISLATSNNVNLLVGTLDGNGDESHLEYYNAVYLIESNGDWNQKYYKTHLVPFGEYLPMESWFPILKTLPVVPSHFTPGKELTQFNMLSDSAKTKFSTLICFESIVPGIARAIVNKGAQFLVIVTNDSWFGKSSAPYQHRDIAVFRAIENNVPIIRAANTGYSCFINSKGQLLQGLDIYKTGTLVQRLSIQDHPTLTIYNKYGDWLPVLCGIILLILLAIQINRLYLSPK